MSNLTSIIEDLISLKKEGSYWDFKLRHPNNPVDLVKDIICLANTIQHKGPRYLIFGVCDESYEIKDIEGTESRRTQTDIIDTLRNASFSGGYFPNVRLEILEINRKEVDIIVIEDLPNKPYILEKDYKEYGKEIRAGVVYSRIEDRNTESNRSASIADIEKMWRERFGLDETPLNRLKKYLLDFNGWENFSEHSWYYQQFPEFTIRSCSINIRGEERSEWPVEAGEDWVRVYPDANAYVVPITANFHQTPLVPINCISVDGGKRPLIPAPILRLIISKIISLHFAQRS